LNPPLGPGPALPPCIPPPSRASSACRWRDRRRPLHKPAPYLPPRTVHRTRVPTPGRNRRSACRMRLAPPWPAPPLRTRATRAPHTTHRAPRRQSRRHCSVPRPGPAPVTTWRGQCRPTPTHCRGPLGDTGGGMPPGASPMEVIPPRRKPRMERTHNLEPRVHSPGHPPPSTRMSCGSVPCHAARDISWPPRQDGAVFRRLSPTSAPSTCPPALHHLTHC